MIFNPDKTCRFTLNNPRIVFYKGKKILRKKREKTSNENDNFSNIDSKKVIELLLKKYLSSNTALFG